ncbi:hypothetical protein DV515_00011814 [Chloebia gouldiae]|uniref:Uncharacterized protein n=1 Tax=Chloebia gouldiae TaxID=44316 RepID=A0A3L8S6R6_CHLGU|nr:hypothetical protein DV515_00011814 [Chloebia gouldiae]
MTRRAGDHFHLQSTLAAVSQSVLGHRDATEPRTPPAEPKLMRKQLIPAQFCSECPHPPDGASGSSGKFQKLSKNENPVLGARSEQVLALHPKSLLELGCEQWRPTLLLGRSLLLQYVQD